MAASSNRHNITTKVNFYGHVYCVLRRLRRSSRLAGPDASRESSALPSSRCSASNYHYWRAIVCGHRLLLWFGFLSRSYGSQTRLEGRGVGDQKIWDELTDELTGWPAVLISSDRSEGRTEVCSESLAL